MSATVGCRGLIPTPALFDEAAAETEKLGAAMSEPFGTLRSMTESHSSTAAQRARWWQRATWLTQLGLASEDPAPVDAVEEVADAVLVLLQDVRRLELERAEPRAWAWSHLHGELMYEWVSVAGRDYDGDPGQLPAWLVDPRAPDAQDWWPRVTSRGANEPGTVRQPRRVRRVDEADLEPWQQDLLRESRAQSALEREAAEEAREAARRDE